MGIGGIWQWVVILLVVALIFGTKRLRGMGTDLGQAIKGFRSGMREGKDSNDSPRVEVEAESASGASSDDKTKTAG